MKKTLFKTLITLLILAQQSFAAVQSETVPFGKLKSQLELQPGQTYLHFMKTQVNPALNALDPEIEKEQQQYPKQYKRWQQDLIQSGIGVAIRIDGQNYMFNVGYRDGSRAEDVKSGRSYGVGPTGRQSDPSDIAYLTELEKYLQSEPQASQQFFTAILNVLTNCDSSGWHDLSEQGQIVATDFLAIYTAESDCHIMVNLEPRNHPWEIDLAAATFSAPFVVTSKTMVKQGKSAPGRLVDFWAQGATGSGIGNTRKDRIRLQQLMAEVISQKSAGRQVIEKINSVIGSSDKDVIQGVLLYLNAPQGPEKLSARDSRLGDLLNEFISLTTENAEAISSVINK